MTEKLYDKDAYKTEFTAEVLNCEQIDNEYWIILNRTLFFPESGGQTPDVGSLVIDKDEKPGCGGCISDGYKAERIEVSDVQIREGVIYHKVSAEIDPGRKVIGKIDWKHRFDNMQQHSAEHIFSGTVHRLYGYDNAGFHLSDNTVTMDFNGVLDEEQVREVESIVNRAIYENIEIIVSFPTDEECENIDFRSKKEIDGQIRLVTIPGYDICACCAPHVRRTGEIGILKVEGFQRYKGGVRVRILCGNRAFTQFRAEHDLMNKLSVDFSVPYDEIGGRIEDLKDEIEKLKSKLIETNRKLSEIKRNAVPKDKKNVVLVEDEMDAITMRKSVNSLMEEHPGYCGIFAGNAKSGYRYIIGIKDGDAGIVQGLLKEICDAKGGGSPQMVQGTAQNINEEDLYNFWDRLDNVVSGCC
ncbi:MAG: hypothetical protein K5669_03560 [Lachnospiraceae bacterium]|nr:hypothetical protein [Lachnospiraceae bacterium]